MKEGEVDYAAGQYSDAVAHLNAAYVHLGRVWFRDTGDLRLDVQRLRRCAQFLQDGTEAREGERWEYAFACADSVLILKPDDPGALDLRQSTQEGRTAAENRRKEEQTQEGELIASMIEAEHETIENNSPPVRQRTAAEIFNDFRTAYNNHDLTLAESYLTELSNNAQPVDESQRQLAGDLLDYTKKAVAFEQNGNLSDACSVWRQILDKDPGNTWAQQSIADDCCSDDVARQKISQATDQYWNNTENLSNDDSRSRARELLDEAIAAACSDQIRGRARQLKHLWSLGS
jgi:tetratricopeptide (TPR) repeat protein